MKEGVVFCERQKVKEQSGRGAKIQSDRRAKWQRNKVTEEQSGKS